MLTEDEVLELVEGLARDDLAAWHEMGMVRPARESGRAVYREVDVARVRLIVEIRDELEIKTDCIPMVLSLIDQVHGLRRELHRLASVIDALPEDTRRQVLDQALAQDRGRTPDQGPD